MDDFQSFGGYFPSKTDFTPPYPPISGHSVIAPSKFSLNTVSLCIDRRYWSFGYYHDWWALYDCAKMMGGCIPSLSRLQEGPWPSSMPSSIPRSPAQGQGDGLGTVPLTRNECESIILTPVSPHAHGHF